MLDLHKKTFDAARSGLGVSKLQRGFVTERKVFLTQPLCCPLRPAKHIRGPPVKPNEPQDSLGLIGLQSPLFLALAHRAPGDMEDTGQFFGG